ncbi:MAG: hypothetical protein OXE48_07965, partial [Gammaproteobacteria bacterium]|nr:hypothetical protein [Gammaproteobacteria bacterium]
LAALTAALLLAALTLPANVQAQVNTVGLEVSSSVMLEELGCATGINLTSSANIPSGTQVRYYVSMDFGFNHFRNHGVLTLLADGETLSEIPSNVITADTAGAGTSVLLPGLCVADDRIDPSAVGSADGSKSSSFTIRLMSVAGFMIDRNRDSAKMFVRGNDSCAQPDANGLNGGVVYKFRNGNMNDSCVCMSKSSVVAAGIADGETESYATTALKWRTDSTDYCPSSPYQRPGG